MPFELISTQTIDMENGNKLLDIYTKYSDVINDVYNLIREVEHCQTMSNENLVKLVNIKDTMNAVDDKLWIFTNEFIDEKGIRNALYRKRELES